MNSRRVVYLGLGVVVLVCVVTVIIFASRSTGTPSPIAQQTSTTTTPVAMPVPQGMPSFAAPGKLVAGFPQVLILDASSSIGKSYTINYASSTNQYTTEWTSANAIEIVYNDYISYMKANNWVITNEITQYSDSRGIYATQGSSTILTVSILAKGSGSDVTVSYVGN